MVLSGHGLLVVPPHTTPQYNATIGGGTRSMAWGRSDSRPVVGLGTFREVVAVLAPAASGEDVPPCILPKLHQPKDR